MNVSVLLTIFRRACDEKEKEIHKPREGFPDGFRSKEDDDIILEYALSKVVKSLNHSPAPAAPVGFDINKLRVDISARWALSDVRFDDLKNRNLALDIAMNTIAALSQKPIPIRFEEWWETNKQRIYACGIVDKRGVREACELIYTEFNVVLPQKAEEIAEQCRNIDTSFCKMIKDCPNCDNFEKIHNCKGEG